jgi:spore coat protein CotH
MKNNDYLESFLSSVEKNEIPDNATLKGVAASLRKMQDGASFKSAFNLKKKRGPIPFNEKGFSEIMPIFKAMEEYHSMREQEISGEMAKSKICDAYDISERTFDNYHAFYNDFLEDTKNLLIIINKLKNELKAKVEDSLHRHPLLAHLLAACVRVEKE